MAVKQVEMSTSGPITKEFEALEKEIRMLSAFEHERIVKYYGSEKKEQSFSIFMEYMPGGSLWDDLKRQGPFHEPLVRKYTGQILEGLQYLHSNSIIHRDIKGQNILLSSSHDVKLADFGTAKSIEGIQTVTGLTAQVGTCNWMSPEMIRGEKYGRKTDIW
jgi:serine/threonine protein kinase